MEGKKKDRHGDASSQLRVSDASGRPLQARRSVGKRARPLSCYVTVSQCAGGSSAVSSLLHALHQPPQLTQAGGGSEEEDGGEDQGDGAAG